MSSDIAAILDPASKQIMNGLNKCKVKFTTVLINMFLKIVFLKRSNLILQKVWRTIRFGLEVSYGGSNNSFL